VHLDVHAIRMLIETRTLGRKSRPLDRWSVPDLPVDDEREGDDDLTLRALITRIVRSEVRAFERREQARRLLRVLSDHEIAAGAERGKVDSGGRDPGDPVSEEAAIGAALQGFEDGLFLVVLDGAEQRDLDAPVFVTRDSHLVFLRLTFLAGA
jgi:hypothetical protein